MGIPLLHPWANRLGGFAYSVDGVDVELARDSPEIRLEEHGLPMHGLVSALHEWEVVEAGDARGSWPGSDLRGLAEFPFDHRVEVAAELSGGRLTLTTTVTPTGRPAPCRSPSATTRTSSCRASRGPSGRSRCRCASTCCWTTT